MDFYQVELEDQLNILILATKDLIVRDNAKISSTAIDAGAPFANFGEVNNKGVDFDIVYADETNSGFNYEVAFNLSSYKNTVVSLVGDTPITGIPYYRAWS